MIVISYGNTQSGSTLAFEMTRAILELNGYSQALLPDDLVEEGHPINFIRHWTDERLARLIESTRGTRVVIKTHRSGRALTRLGVADAIEAGDLKIHVVFRDPRDTVAAQLDHGFRARRDNGPVQQWIRTVDAAIDRLSRQLVLLREWGSFPSLKLSYEQFAFDMSAGPKLIADDLGLSADPDDVWRTVNSRFTQKNLARPERHKTDLWPDEIARIERAFPLYLELVRGNEPAGWFKANW